MTLIINGTATDMKEGLSVEGLLKELDIEPGRVAVEVNVNIIKKVNYQEYQLQDGDSVEIVNFVGGG